MSLTFTCHSHLLLFPYLIYWFTQSRSRLSQVQEVCEGVRCRRLAHRRMCEDGRPWLCGCDLWLPQHGPGRRQNRRKEVQQRFPQSEGERSQACYFFFFFEVDIIFIFSRFVFFRYR